MYEVLQLNSENGILILTINRPEKLNALNNQVFVELNRALDDIEKDESVRSVIITGSGPKAFVAGADISEFNGLDQASAKKLAGRGQETFFRIERSLKPIVAAVNGFALGGGCELAMSCHFRTASTNAKFGQPEVNLGLIPGYGGTQRMVQLMGKGRALELMMSAQMITADQALQYGLVNHVFPAESLLEETKKILSTINTKAPLAVASCIKAANAVYDEKLNGYELEIEEFGKCFITEDMKEGTTAFMEKRAASFKGR